MSTILKFQVGFLILQIVCLLLSIFNIGMPYTMLYTVFGSIPVLTCMGINLYFFYKEEGVINNGNPQ